MFGDIKDNYAWALKRNYNLEKIGEINIAIFQLMDKNWQRLDNTWLVKCYSGEEVLLTLKKCMFWRN